MTPKNIWNQKNLVKKYYDNEMIFGKKNLVQNKFLVGTKKKLVKKVDKKKFVKKYLFCQNN